MTQGTHTPPPADVPPGGGASGTEGGTPPSGSTLPDFMPPFGFGPNDPNYSAEDLVTRQMCAAVHLDGPFANKVGGELMAVPHKAIWPVWDAVDYTVLARHAKWSRERRLVRDLALALLMLALIGSWVAIGLVAWLSGGLPWGLTLLAVALIATWVWVAARRIVKAYFLETIDIVAAIREKPAEANERLGAWDGLPPPASSTDFLSIVYRAMARFNVAIVKARFFLIDWWKWVRGRGAFIHEGENPVLPPFDYLASMYDANVILFQGDQKPFGMAGVTLDDWNLTVDVNRQVNGVDHAATLSARDLHDKLVEEVPGGLLPQLRSRSVVVANGMHPKELGLFAETDEESKPGHTPGWYTDHPQNRVSRRTIENWLQHPPEGARVYAYFQKYAWRGHLVIGTAVNVYRGGNTLNIECNTHVLPPLQDEFNNMFDIPENPINLRKAMRRTLRVYTPKLLLQSLRANYNNFFTPSGRQTVVRQLHKQRDEESRIDYGSRINIRLAASDASKMWRYPYVDDLEFARVIRDKVLEVTRRYLESYGVPLAQFDEQVRIMRERKMKYDSEGEK
ncbi:hypothetical protein ACIB24_03400 [Spongisporangium articulatum]|uniref:Uncharacterized protein n=1 Tax=Spongisporangium articulatum TaxID=3362603 RepID=A0ABW8AIB9_9ACTN